MNTSFSNQINRRQLLAAGLGAMAWASVDLGHAGNRRTPERPNILFLMSDQHRGDCLGADGNSVISTPNMDRLANEGARFRCAYSSTPSCTPARAGILTGLSPWRHGMLGYHRIAERYKNEMPRMLRKAGYYTQVIGKCHYHPQRNLHGFHHGILDESGRELSVDFRSDYRAWFASTSPTLDPDATGIGWNDYQAASYALPERLHPTHWTGDVACRFLENYQGKAPFFLKVSFARPHSPYDPPARLMKKYAAADLPQAAVGQWAGRHAVPEPKGSSSLWRGDLGAEQVRHSRQGYYGAVNFVDEQIGRILESLEKRDLLENTLIVYTSDHGDMVGDHHLWRKCYAYEASARVPMLLRWPQGMLSARRGEVFRQPVEMRDLLPTFLDAAGIDADSAEFDGRSLLDPIRGQTAGWREYIDLEHDICYSRENHWNALTDGATKYIFHALDGRQQLFDLEKDPGEINDLSSEPAHAGSLGNWRARMLEHLQVRGAPFVKNGELALRPDRHTLGKHYPRQPRGSS